jgi:hypothetical protein
MKILRIILLVVVCLLSAGAGFGFLSERSLDDSAGFAASMGDALNNPKVKSEIEESVKTSALELLDGLSEQGGLVGSVVGGLNPEALSSTVAKSVNTPAFAQAWDDWALLLHRGLADFATNTPNPNVQVSGQVMEVRVGPLITPLLGDGIAANFSGIVDSIIGDRTIAVDTGEDIEQRLHNLGFLAGARWYFAGGALIAFVLTVLIGPRRVAWLAGSLIAVAVGFAGVAAWSLVDDTVGAASQSPALTEAISNSLTGNWPLIMGISALVLLAAAIVIALLDRIRTAKIDERTMPA